MFSKTTSVCNSFSDVPSTEYASATTIHTAVAAVVVAAVVVAVAKATTAKHNMSAALLNDISRHYKQTNNKAKNRLG